MDICDSKGNSPPFRRMFQYIQRNIILPQWLTADSFNRENGPKPGNGNLPGKGSTS